MSAAASAKHESFVMITSHTQRERGGSRPPDRLYSWRWSIWAVSKLPATKAAGQMDLLTVPSVDGVDSKVIQVKEASSASSCDR